MKTKQQQVRKSNKANDSGMPPGKVKAPKPVPAPAPTESAATEDTPVKPEEQETDKQVLAPDGEPQPAQKLEPLF